MSRHKTRKAAADFDKKFQRLRLKIDSLPPEHRPHLYELADTIAMHHRRSQSKSSSNNDSKCDHSPFD